MLSFDAKRIGAEADSGPGKWTAAKIFRTRGVHGGCIVARCYSSTMTTVTAIRRTKSKAKAPPKTTSGSALPLGKQLAHTGTLCLSFPQQ
jgi:hypothetical protein